MEPIPAREIVVRIRFAVVPVSSEGWSTVLCLNCQQPLDVHQPDPESPDRVLGTCETCKRWHLVDSTSDAASTVVVLLPDAAPFLAESARPPGPADVPRARSRRRPT